MNNNIPENWRCGCEKCEERQRANVSLAQAAFGAQRTAGITGAPYKQWTEPGTVMANDPRDRSIGAQAALMALTKKIQEADIATIAVMEENETLTQCVTLLQTANDKLRKDLTLEQTLHSGTKASLDISRDELSRERSGHVIQRMADAGSSFERELNAVYDRARVAAILATFYRAELSMSSVAPVLALAEELNQGLKR